MRQRIAFGILRGAWGLLSDATKPNNEPQIFRPLTQHTSESLPKPRAQTCGPQPNKLKGDGSLANDTGRSQKGRGNDVSITWRLGFLSIRIGDTTRARDQTNHNLGVLLRPARPRNAKGHASPRRPAPPAHGRGARWWRILFATRVPNDPNPVNAQ